jgi:hypothetical protein
MNMMGQILKPKQNSLIYGLVFKVRVNQEFMCSSPYQCVLLFNPAFIEKELEGKVTHMELH